MPGRSQPAPVVRPLHARSARPARAVSSEGDVRVGVSGWRYPPWRSVFYPKGLPQNQELSYVSRAVRTVEINGSFYSLQRPSSYLAWREETPAHFVFAVKGGRFITHNKKLKDCRGPLANFLASGVLALEEKLGPILWQLPPQLGFDAERIESFLAGLPKSTWSAAALAASHDERIKHGAYLDVRADRRLRHALEVRHPSFDDPRFYEILARYDVALCIADTAGKWPYLPIVTTDFVYLRLHGSKRLYASGYSRAELDEWADRIHAWRTGNLSRGARARDVYVYFDNDAKVRAPFDAMNLAARFGHGQHVSFPRSLQRAAEAMRGVEEPRGPSDRWRYSPRVRTTA
jgi:uncharacterized protein YecE (DUF72 family)